MNMENQVTLIKKSAAYQEGPWIFAWSPDSKALAMLGEDPSEVEIWQMAFSGCTLVSKLSDTYIHPSDIGALAWSSDGTRVLAGAYDDESNLAIKSWQVIKKEG
jgi:WD40 repeat protein